MSTVTDMGKFQKSPNGNVLVKRPEASAETLRKMLGDQSKEEGLIYIPKNNEVAQLSAAMKLGQPIALIGPPGIGKTTLVRAMARMQKLPLTTVMGKQTAKIHELVGYLQDTPEGVVYFDGLISQAVRANTPSILYIDEAIEQSGHIFTSLSSLFDNRRMLYLDPTGEALNANHVSVIIAFNPPQIDMRDQLPTPATLDRFVMIRFSSPSGADALGVLKLKYGIGSAANALGSPVQNTAMTEALKKHGESLAKIYDELNSKIATAHSSVVVKKVTPRSMESTLLLISAGISLKEAVDMAMITPMVPLEDEMVDRFMAAAGQIAESNKSRK